MDAHEKDVLTDREKVRESYLQVEELQEKLPNLLEIQKAVEHLYTLLQKALLLSIWQDFLPGQCILVQHNNVFQDIILSIYW